MEFLERSRKGPEVWLRYLKGRCPLLPGKPEVWSDGVEGRRACGGAEWGGRTAREELRAATLVIGCFRVHLPHPTGSVMSQRLSSSHVLSPSVVPDTEASGSHWTEKGMRTEGPSWNRLSLLLAEVITPPTPFDISSHSNFVCCHWLLQNLLAQMTGHWGLRIS